VKANAEGRRAEDSLLFFFLLLLFFFFLLLLLLLLLSSACDQKLCEHTRSFCLPSQALQGRVALNIHMRHIHEACLCTQVDVRLQPASNQSSQGTTLQALNSTSRWMHSLLVHHEGKIH
jgi:hypothetical protein